ncbi:cyclic nucleotide-gated cation channel beta-1-like isoform X2 [Pectinophora gossypiella]|uniref:cyclic nucleotide-gated cation channel beta-1-like isoform X2 n=1 Tax=Pectinophora gossypiella TaxID=13191 RepID=UPI00214ED953|nr:cyclic nucleotide-gated cation channel beta-1-like isoform X2 [Pectinophora gossypiella]
MKMETKVDVHTVHPTSLSDQPSKHALPKGPYGSWCTPEATPAHTTLSPTDSTVDTKSKTQDDTKCTRVKEIILVPQKVTLFPDSPPPDYEFEADTTEHNIELKELKKSNSADSAIKRFSPDSEKSSLPVETPQSPVPSSPLKDKKWRSLRLPFCCDPFLPIDPQGRGYISWLLLVTFCYSYNAWCIPLRATFPYQTPHNTPLWMAMDYFCDVIYVLDVALVKPRLMFLHEGFWVADLAETKKNYRRKLQYKFDMISLLPLDLLYFYFGPQRVILRVPRMLKLQTFWEFHQAMDRVLSSPYVVRIGKMLFYIFYLIHLNACAYYAMSDYIGLGSNGWVYDNEGNAYIRCFYFATKTATSIGKNPKPENTGEYLFMTAAWLMGVFVFALLIGQIRDIIATATRARAEYRKTVDGCTEYLRRLNMPSSLQRRVTSWFSYTWSQQRCFDESRILNSLPYNMKRDVALAVHMSTLSKVQLFRDCSDSLLRDLVLQLRPVSFLPGDVVVRAGDVGHDMYIIKSGECCVMSHDENEVLATLKEGSVFGEISLLGIDGLRRRTATVRSRGYSSLFALSRNDLDAALKHHKEAAQILRLRADQIIRENAARQAKQRLVKVEAKKSTSLEESGTTVRKRRLSSTSSNSSALEARRHRSASAQSRRRLSAVSEIKGEKPNQGGRPSLASACSGVRTPLPTIVLSSD